MLPLSFGQFDNFLKRSGGKNANKFNVKNGVYPSRKGHKFLYFVTWPSRNSNEEKNESIKKRRFEKAKRNSIYATSSIAADHHDFLPRMETIFSTCNKMHTKCIL